jgi:hypothetical protein
MPIIKLGSRPKSFERTVKFKDVDGTELAVPVIFKYRTLTEFGSFVDQWTADQKAAIEAEAATLENDRKKAQEAGEKFVEPTITNEEIRKEEAKSNTDYLMRILDGWKLDDAFTAAAVLQFCNEFPGGARAVVFDYRAAIVEGHLGN